MKNRIYEDFVANLPPLDGKVVAISGTTSGTIYSVRQGYWAAYAIITKNAAALLLLNRKSSRSDKSLALLEKAKEKLKSQTTLVQVECDLMSFESVKNAAAKITSFCGDKGGLDVLCNNAGIMGFPDLRTVDGYDQQIQTNHLSSFLLCRELLGVLKQAVDTRGEARIVNHSSGARNAKLGIDKSLKGHLDGRYFDKQEPGDLGGDAIGSAFGRYHQSKLANSVFTMELYKRLQAAKLNIKAIAADPGVATTDLGSNLASAQTSSCLKCFAACLNPCAQTCIFPLFAQSGPDGSCPLLAGCFAEDAESGDMYIPKKVTKGIPVKAIAAGVENTTVVEASSEELTLNEESGKTLWTKSEAAVGVLSFT